jgi:steroid delta-isomerase-like uncharacterized protein
MFRSILLPVACTLLLFSACDRQAVSIDRAKKIADIYAEARNTGNYDLLDQIMDPDIIVVDPSLPGPVSGREKVKEMYSKATQAFPDYTITFTGIDVCRDKVVFNWSVTATNTEPIETLPPTGKTVRFSGVAVSRIEDGKIIEDNLYYNLLSVYRQLGFSLVPPRDSL